MYMGTRAVMHISKKADALMMTKGVELRAGFLLMYSFIQIRTESMFI